jgi:hypothetical protein
VARFSCDGFAPALGRVNGFFIRTTDDYNSRVSPYSLQNPPKIWPNTLAGRKMRALTAVGQIDDTTWIRPAGRPPRSSLGVGRKALAGESPKRRIRVLHLAVSLATRFFDAQKGKRIASDAAKWEGISAKKQGAAGCRAAPLQSSASLAPSVAEGGLAAVDSTGIRCPGRSGRSGPGNRGRGRSIRSSRLCLTTRLIHQTEQSPAQAVFAPSTATTD